MNKNSKNIDYLVIDLIDERFDIFSIGSSVVTLSNEIINAGFNKLLIKGKRILCGSDEYFNF